ncbi:MAG: DNA cytosine methyltransferase [Deltaproteobacteria bacterium]
MKPSVISLFTGAGGLDLGLEAAGFEFVVGVERDGAAVETLRINRPAWKVLHNDLHDLGVRGLLRAAGARRGDVDLVAGGPPCQPFSKSGYWHAGDAKRLADPRAATLDAFLAVVDAARPRAFLLENVPGIAFSEKSEGLRHIHEFLGRMKGASYSVTAMKLNAVDFGVPQMRERVFVVGCRGSCGFRAPVPTHRRPVRQNRSGPTRRDIDAETDALKPTMTAWEAIGRLKDDADPQLKPRGFWAELLPTIPEGQNYLFHTERGSGQHIFGWRRRYWSMLLKLAKDLPSWTITASPGPAIGPFHWNNRRLSARELCRLQTFPLNFKVSGDAAAFHRQLGNAVPAAMAEILGLEIRRQIFGDDSVSQSDVSLLPRRVRCIPAPSPPSPFIHRKYRELIGLQTDHPGTGKGPGARARAEL